MLKFKIDVMDALKSKGYTTTKLRKDKIIPEGTLTKIRKGAAGSITGATINTLCSLLHKQPGQLLEYVQDIGANQE